MALLEPRICEPIKLMKRRAGIERFRRSIDKRASTNISLQSRKSTNTDRDSEKEKSVRNSEQLDSDYSAVETKRDERNYNTANIYVEKFDENTDLNKNPFAKLSDLVISKDLNLPIEKAKGKSKQKEILKIYEFRRLKNSSKPDDLNLKVKEQKQMFLCPPQKTKMERNNKRRISDYQIDKNKIETQDICYQMTQEIEEREISNFNDEILSKNSVKIPDEYCDLRQLLPPQDKKHKNKKTLVIDLDETLVHSKFTETVEKNPDHSFQIQLHNEKFIPSSNTSNLNNEKNGTNLQVHLYLRPGAVDFIKEMSKYYEIIIFTASIPIYANKVIDIIDPDKLISHRLFRSSCVEHKSINANGDPTSYWVKDLSRLSRFIDDIIILDNSPSAYIYQKENALPVKSWTGQPDDCELYLLASLLKMVAKFGLDFKYVLLNVVGSDLSVDHDKFGEIVNSAISKPDFAAKTKDYRKAHEASKSPACNRHSLIYSRNTENAMLQTECITKDVRSDDKELDNDYQLLTLHSMNGSKPNLSQEFKNNFKVKIANSVNSKVISQFEKSCNKLEISEEILDSYKNKRSLRKLRSQPIGQKGNNKKML